MAAVTQNRALAGCRMSMQAKQTVKVTNGAKYFMRRRDSYMVEVRHWPQPGAGPRALKPLIGALQPCINSMLTDCVSRPLPGPIGVDC
jgi:hypothetical protein